GGRDGGARRAVGHDGGPGARNHRRRSRDRPGRDAIVSRPLGEGCGPRQSASDSCSADSGRSGESMKLVTAIVRPEKVNDVLEALYRAEVRGISMSRVQGHGGELDRVETYRGTTVQVGLSEKVRFEVAVSDDFVQRTIDAFCAGARTGEVGDGK